MSGRAAPSNTARRAVRTVLAVAVSGLSLGGAVAVAVSAADPARAVAASLLLGVAVGGGFAAWFEARVASPLRGARDDARALGGGGPPVAVPERGSATARAVASAFARVAADLGEALERATEERETRELILGAMAEGVVLAAPDGAIRYANDAAGAMLGALRGARLPAPLHDAAAAAGAAGAAREREIEGDAGATVRAVALPAGERGLVLLVLRDITASRRTEAIRRDFAASASHELKTPVASIQAVAETLVVALEEDREAAARFASQLLDESRRLSRIVVDLLDLSRLEAGALAAEPVALDRVVEAEAARYEPRARSAGIAIERDVAPASVLGSPADLVLLVSNLLDNAIRFTKPGGSVRVSLSTVAGGSVRLEVSDTGIGIPSRDLPRIFERFYRVDRARSRASGGTGLGLSIVKHVAEQHHATVDVRSELSAGSTFTVVFPAVRGPREASTNYDPSEGS